MTSDSHGTAPTVRGTEFLRAKHDPGVQGADTPVISAAGTWVCTPGRQGPRAPLPVSRSCGQPPRLGYAQTRGRASRLGAGPCLARPRESRHAKCACVGLPPAAGRFTQRLRAPRLRRPRTAAPLIGSEGRVGSAHPRGGLSPLTACAHRACAGGGRWLRLRLGTVRPSALAVRTLNSAENAAEVGFPRAAPGAEPRVGRTCPVRGLRLACA